MGRKSESGVTLIEIVLVIVIIGVAGSLMMPNLSFTKRWNQESEIRKLSEVITFLYNRAIIEGKFYRLEFHMSEPGYQLGEIAAEGIDNSAFEELASADAEKSNLSLKLATFLNPSQGEYQNMIPPKAFPSLGKPVKFVSDLKYTDIKNIKGTFLPGDSENPGMIFTPKGYADFTVIHLTLDENEDRQLTIFANPFTGISKIYREYKDFEWKYNEN